MFGDHKPWDLALDNSLRPEYRLNRTFWSTAGCFGLYLLDHTRTFGRKMKPAPKTVGTFRVVCYSPIDERHRFTGKTKQIVRGELMGAMAGLAICQPTAAQEFYLFGCDSDWNVVTDTWHQSLDEAKEQAEFEYEGIGRTWSYFQHPDGPQPR